jgi:hypothetical protein
LNTRAGCFTRWWGEALKMDDLKVTFRGGLAEQHRLPAYAASQSLYGISRALLITTNYLSEGRVRRRDFDPRRRGFDINLIATRPGSFEFLFEILADPAVHTIGQSVIGKVAGDFTVAFIKSVFQRVTGGSAEPEVEELESSGELHSGDIGALVEAIEPAMKAAHNTVNHGATNIVIVSGRDNIVNLDASTKRYVFESIADERPQQKAFSIASFNANSFTGRAYDYDRRQTVPFDLFKGADRNTLSAIMSSMASYTLRNHGTNETESLIAMEYTSTLAADGRVKKVHVIKARKELRQLRG